MARKSKAEEAADEGALSSSEVGPVAEGSEPSEPAPPAPAVDAEQLHRELEASQRRADELATRLQYLQAELENQRKRAEREVDLAIRLANEALVAQFLPVLDAMDAAVASVPGEAGKGFLMLRENMLRLLTGAGLEEIPAVGTAFDPYLHEAVQQVQDGSLKDGTVKDVVRKGYRYRMKVMRPAQVVVVDNGGETNA